MGPLWGKKDPFFTAPPRTVGNASHLASAVHAEVSLVGSTGRAIQDPVSHQQGGLLPERRAVEFTRLI